MAKIVFNSIEKVERFLRSRGIDKRYIFSIRNALIADAITQADGLTVARFYTAFGLVLHKDYGMNEEQLCEIYEKVGKIMQEVGNEESDWVTKMKELQDLTGITIVYNPEFSEVDLPEEYEERGVE